ncbi:AraC family transcriptional regulator [Pelagicoccus mobilis]|uniref:Helix-turn-helix domain-containing protein n=1 Tax=Pelagicoccus mobilis TaxID=415221 RepID=A0A934VTV6_9BACT|nr:AraC family transcriptional regulator [Pelagicoccus mobilis]MBK1880118.1 helix-turn-helix domain-containing protein [Pelagicoccus mobilis]
MKTESAKKVFEVSVEELSSWGDRPHKHNFFEIVYVEKGEGIQCINKNLFEYREGNIFLLPPLDCHSFKIAKPSRFYFIRFTDHYFLKEDGLTRYAEWFDRIAYILANYNKVPGDIISSEREREFIVNSIKSIHREYTVSDSYSESIIAGAVAGILSVLARSIENRYVDQANEIDNRFGEVLRYINTNVENNEKLRVDALSVEFGISPSYFSEYFKKNAGTSLKDYIIKSKLRIVETKVLHSDASLKEIAYQLGFTDSSHLSRCFKKVYGMTVKGFREARIGCGVLAGPLRNEALEYKANQPAIN